jgi:peroxiredoxin
VYEQWKPTGVKFVGIGLLDTREACRGFVARHHLSFPNGYDVDGRIAKRYGFTYQPYWAVIDRGGRLVKAGFGPEGQDELTAAVRALTAR